MGCFGFFSNLAYALSQLIWFFVKTIPLVAFLIVLLFFGLLPDQAHDLVKSLVEDPAKFSYVISKLIGFSYYISLLVLFLRCVFLLIDARKEVFEIIAETYRGLFPKREVGS